MGPDLQSAAACFASGYLIGGIPFGLIVGLARGVDVRREGSGNIGATNVGRALGKRWGLFVLALDILKGCLPVLFLAPFLARLLGAGSAELAAGTCGFGALTGHVFSPYLGFRGGKGVATSIGVFGALLWHWMLIPLGAYALLRKTTGYVSAGSLALAVLLPAAAVARHRSDLQSGLPIVIISGLAGGLIMVRHRANIARLFSGKEHAAPTQAGDGPRREGTGDESDS